MLLILEISLSFLLLAVCWTTSCTTKFCLIDLLLLSLNEWGYLCDNISWLRSCHDISLCCWRWALASSMCNESLGTSLVALSSHDWHTSVLTHHRLLKLGWQTHSWWSIITKSSQIGTNSFIAYQILMGYVTELSVMSLCHKVTIIELLLQWCLSLAHGSSTTLLSLITG